MKLSTGLSSYVVDVWPKVSIAVQRVEKDGSLTPKKVFKIGDEAEYDSYNLIYTGKIVSITDKSVTIQPKYAKGNKRLKLVDFAWRNYDFDSDKVAAKNAETSMYI